MIHQYKRPQVETLVLHTNETIMRHKQFQITIEENAGKVINVTYDKHKILNPDVKYEDVKMIDPLPWGLYKIQEYVYKIKNIKNNIMYFLLSLPIALGFYTTGSPFGKYFF